MGPNFKVWNAIRTILFHLKQICTRTFFVPFGIFFAHVSTPTTRTRTTRTTRTTKLLLGPSSRARGQKCTRWATTDEFNLRVIRVLQTFPILWIHHLFLATSYYHQHALGLAKIIQKECRGIKSLLTRIFLKKKLLNGLD